MKILITGAAGFLGSFICEDLLKNGHSLIGVDNFFRGKKENLPNHENFIFHNLDLTDKKKTKQFLSSISPELIIHYAAINGTRYFYDIPHKVCNDNIVMTQNILEYCPITVNKIVFASSSEIYGPSPKVPTKESEMGTLNIHADRDSYASSKLIGEFLVKLWAKQNKKFYLILRPFNTYGPRMATNGYGQVIPEFIERVKSEEEFFLYGDGKQTRSFCHVRDHSRIVSELIYSANDKVLNIGYDEEITIFDLAKTIHELYKKDFNPQFRDEWSHDTKWRKPDLSDLFKYIENKSFINLKSGLKELIKENE